MNILQVNGIDRREAAVRILRHVWAGPVSPQPRKRKSVTRKVVRGTATGTGLVGFIAGKVLWDVIKSDR